MSEDSFLSTCLSFFSTLWSEVEGLNYACACPAGFCLRQKYISPTSQIEKSQSFLSQPSGAKSMNWTTLTLALRVFAFGKNSFPRLRVKQKEASLSTCLSFISTLWRSRWIELRLRLPFGFLPSAKIHFPDFADRKWKKPELSFELFYLNPLASPRGFEPRFLEWKSNVLDRARR